MRESSVERLRDPSTLVVASEPVLHGLLPLHEPPDAVVTQLGQDERRPKEIWKVVLDPVPDAQHTGRRERGLVDAALLTWPAIGPACWLGLGKLTSTKSHSLHEIADATSPVHLSTMSDPEHKDYQLVILDVVDDSVIANANT
jgi:hypothetical protein